MTTLTPEEMKAWKPGDRVRLDGLVLMLSNSAIWCSEDKRLSCNPSILTLPGVTVTKLEDADLLLARECAAKAYEAAGYLGAAASARGGEADHIAAVQSVLLAIKAVRGGKP